MHVKRIAIDDHPVSVSDLVELYDGQNNQLPAVFVAAPFSPSQIPSGKYTLRITIATALVHAIRLYYGQNAMSIRRFGG